jgi:glucosamine-6-phosphate isomerase
MKIQVYKTYADMSEAAAEFIVNTIDDLPAPLLCLPSGDTPTGTLQHLVALAKSKKVDFSKCTFVGLDEWIGMDKSDTGSCQHYVYDKFFHPAGIPESKIIFFNAKADNPQKECDRINSYLKANGPLDVVLVGVGMNGHIGLNEPGVSPEMESHVVELESTTKLGAQKYFTRATSVEKGITLGLKTIMNSRTVVVIANGAKKAEIIQRIIEGPVTGNVPGSILQQHTNCYFFLDEEAASKLTLSLRKTGAGAG